MQEHWERRAPEQYETVETDIDGTMERVQLEVRFL